jgi:hypothetical protein
MRGITRVEANASTRVIPAAALETVVEMGDNRPPAYEENGKVVYRASAVGLCPNALAMIRLGYPLSPRSEMLDMTAEEGELHERAVKEKMRGQGGVVEGEQNEFEFEIVPGQVAIRGHFDAREVAGPNGERGCLEVKSMSKARFEAWTKKGFRDQQFEAYAWQASVLLQAVAAVQQPLIYVVKNRDSGQTDIQTFTRPPFTFAQIRARIATVETMVLKSEIPAECPGGERFFCPMWMFHERGVRKVAEEGVSGAVMRAGLEWLRAKEAADRAAKEVERAKRTLIGLFNQGSFWCEDELVVVVKEEDVDVVDSAELRRMAERAGWTMPIKTQKGRHYVKRG